MKQKKGLLRDYRMEHVNWLVQTVQVPQPPPTRLFSFMNPLAVEIWLFILLAYVLVSLCMWVVARFTPYEWHNSSVCNCQLSNVHHSHSVAINEASVMAAVTRCTNDFSLANSFWFTIGTLMQQGSDLNPKVLQASTAAIFVSFCPSNTPITIDAKWSSFIQTIVDFNKFFVSTERWIRWWHVHKLS